MSSREYSNGGKKMKCRISNQIGEIVIDTEVIARFAGTIAIECFGIVGMAAISMKDGLVRLLKRDSLTHGINVSVEDNRLTIDFHVIVVYGVSISAVSDNPVSYTHLDVYKRQVYTHV